MIGNAAAASRGNPLTSNGSTRGGAMFDIDVAKQVRGTTDVQEALAAFKAEARKTPRERCRDQVMKEWHVTQEHIDSLPAKEAQELNDRIEREVSRRMQTAAPPSHEPMDANEPVSTSPGNSLLPEATPSTLQVLNARGATLTGAVGDADGAQTRAP